MKDKVKRFEEIINEINSLNDEALEICDEMTMDKNSPSDIGQNAYKQWYAHIKRAINAEESGFVGGSGIDMVRSLKGLKNA